MYSIESLQSTTEHIGYENIPVPIYDNVVTHDELTVMVSKPANPLQLPPRAIKHDNSRAVRKLVRLRSAVDYDDLAASRVDINAVRTAPTFAAPFADKSPVWFENLNSIVLSIRHVDSSKSVYREIVDYVEVSNFGFLGTPLESVGAVGVNRPVNSAHSRHSDRLILHRPDKLLKQKGITDTF